MIFAGASLLLSIALESLGHTSHITWVLAAFVLAFLLMYYYYRHARKDENPLFPLHLFQIRTFRIGIFGTIATRLGISSISLLVPLMIQLAYGRSAFASGWIVAPMALTAMFGKSFVIRILNRFGYRRTLVFNTAIIGVIIAALAIPGIHTSEYWFLLPLVLLGFFNSIQFTAMNTLSISDLRQHMTSSGNSLIAVNQQLAIGFGTAFGLLVLKLFQGNAVATQSGVHPAFRYTFLVMGIITILSSVVFRRLHTRDGDNMRS